ncbi:MAG: glycosyltransferase family 2 protein [Verrucomicrobia bacterium]|nr:glycosyltransferase family 2 protein [Verrucomicrobiota bacterium]
MGLHVPRVSIGLPVYNGEKYLRFAVDSILQQDYRDFELIISDNASSDATAEICRRYAESDERVRYSRVDVNLGAAHNIKAVFQQAKGTYFKWQFHDDVCLPGFLRKCVEVFDQAPSSVVLVAPRTEVIDGEGKKTNYVVEELNTRRPRPHQRLADVLRTVEWAPAQNGLFRRDVLKKTRLIDAFIASDYVLLAEIALRGEILQIPEVLFQKRFHLGISIKANKNLTDFQAWIDPSRRTHRRFLSPRLHLGIEFARSISRSSMPQSERLLCYLTCFAVWYSREGRRAAANFRNKLALRTRLKECVVGASRNSLDLS